VAETLLGKNVVHVLCRRSSLKFLTIQHLLLQLIKGLAGRDMSLGDLAVTSSGTGRDQICNATGLEKGLILNILVKHLGKLAHLIQPNANDGSLGVVAKPMERVRQREREGCD